MQMSSFSHQLHIIQSGCVKTLKMAIAKINFLPITVMKRKRRASFPMMMLSLIIWTKQVSVAEN